MFKTISINQPIRQGKKKVNKIIDFQKVNFSFWRPEWQQDIQSIFIIFYDVKRLTDNIMILGKKYLKRKLIFKIIHKKNLLLLQIWEILKH